MRLAPLVLLAACGRVGFDARGDGGIGDTTRDAPGGPLLAHYTCDALTGGVLADASGNGNDGTCTSCPVIMPGKHAGACSFSGSGLVDIPPLGMTTFGVAMWLNLAPVPVVFCPANRGFNTAASTDNSWQLCMKSDNTWFFNVGTPEYYATMPFPSSSWHHVVIDWDGTTARIFLDGVSVFSGAAAAPAYDASPITLGADIDNGQPAAETDGLIDDVYIYNRALTAAEIATLSAP